MNQSVSTGGHLSDVWVGVIINKAAIYICDQVWTFPTHPNKYKEDPLLDCSVVQPGLVCDELG